MASSFGCCSVSIRARHECSVFGLDTEACEARLCGQLTMAQGFEKVIKDLKKATIFDLGRTSFRRSIAK